MSRVICDHCEMNNDWSYTIMYNDKRVCHPCKYELERATRKFRPNREIVVDTTKLKDSALGTNPKDLLGIKKVNLHLAPPSAVVYLADAMEDGAKKYGPYNWRKNKVTLSIYLDACERHLKQYFDGQDNAEDSGKSHLAHAIACLGIIIDAKETGNLVDDRPIPGNVSNLIERLKKG